jgi:transcription termination/antitermination protein NusA
MVVAPNGAMDPQLAREGARVAGAKTDFIQAIDQISAEKGVSQETVLGAIEAALVSAYKRNFNAANHIVFVRIHRQTGEVKVFTQKTVVHSVSDPRSEVSIEEAQQIRPGVTPGSTVEVETTPQNFGRIAAQTAKQVVLQRLREAERDLVYEEFTDREGDIINGVVQRIEAKGVIVDLGRTEAILPPTEQVPTESYRPGQRFKLFLVEVNRTPKGPQIVVSRTHRNLVKRLLELEVPEIYSGVVEIKAIAREPGSRSKVAVHARQAGVDPVGSCVGVRGVRIENVRNELRGEKVDVVPWHADPAVFVANALSPAQVISVDLQEADKTASVTVLDRQLSLAIGREGQNARLAAKLTGWRVDIKGAAGSRETEMVSEESVQPLEFGGAPTHDQ